VTAGGDAAPRVPQLAVAASQVGDQLEGEFIAGRRHQTTPGRVRGKVTVTLRPHLHHRRP
jgi:hypothetical protein